LITDRHYKTRRIYRYVWNKKEPFFIIVPCGFHTELLRHHHYLLIRSSFRLSRLSRALALR
jgi:hypothetical protein